MFPRNPAFWTQHVVPWLAAWPWRWNFSPRTTPIWRSSHLCKVKAGLVSMGMAITSCQTAGGMTGMTMFCLFEYIFPALLALFICRATCSAWWGKETPTSGTKARRICYGSEKNERFEAQPVQKHMSLIQVLVYLKKQKIERLIIQLKYLQNYVSLGCKVHESFLKPRFTNFSWEKMICLGQLNPP